MIIKIGTRKSRLAIKQAEMVAAAIREKYPDVQTELVYIATQGDLMVGTPLSAISGKGVFVSRLETALADGKIDMAVHSAKDMAVSCADGLAVTGVLERGSPLDALISVRGRAAGNVFGTGSPRRKRMIKAHFPDAVIKDIRGNIDTRLEKLKSGDYDNIILAKAGIDRLGIDMSDFSVTEIDCGPASPCQGIIAIETREKGFAADAAKAISHTRTYFCFETERYAMELLGADCTLPVGAYASVDGGMIRLSLTDDGQRVITGKAEISQRFLLAERMVTEL